MNQQPNNGFYINGFPIQYNKVNQADHYLTDAAFIYVKAFEVIAMQYSQTGTVYYTNAELQEKLGGISERGLQMGIVQLENEGILWRVFKDDSKRHREGFMVDVDKVYELLSLTHKDVETLERGNIKKHIVMQKTTHIKPFYKEMRNAYAQMKRVKNNEKWKAIINELLKQKREYDNYIEASQQRATKAMERKRNRMINRGDIFGGVLNICQGMGYKPPELHVN